MLNQIKTIFGRNHLTEISLHAARFMCLCPKNTTKWNMSSPVCSPKVCVFVANDLLKTAHVSSKAKLNNKIISFYPLTVGKCSVNKSLLLQNTLQFPTVKRDVQYNDHREMFTEQFPTVKRMSSTTTVGKCSISYPIRRQHFSCQPITLHYFFHNYEAK